MTDTPETPVNFGLTQEQRDAWRDNQHTLSRTVFSTLIGELLEQGCFVDVFNCQGEHAVVNCSVAQDIWEALRRTHHASMSVYAADGYVFGDLTFYPGATQLLPTDDYAECHGGAVIMAWDFCPLFVQLLPKTLEQIRYCESLPYLAEVIDNQHEQLE